MLALKNQGIKKAYNELQVISKNEKARMAYEARQAEIHDQMTRIKSAKEEGATEKAIEIARNLINLNIDIETIIKASGLSKDDIEALRVPATTRILSK